jgi:NAD(P)-dependent dehydrogenase (short-subunit alcohol dehydrogenase family)
MSESTVSSPFDLSSKTAVVIGATSGIGLRIEELTGAAEFLASDAASLVTGHVLAVDGGFLASGVNQ